MMGDSSERITTPQLAPGESLLCASDSFHVEWNCLIYVTLTARHHDTNKIYIQLFLSAIHSLQEPIEDTASKRAFARIGCSCPVLNGCLSGRCR